MECYATPWRLLRDSRIWWHIVETSFAFGVILSLSLSLPHCSLFFVFWRVNACLQARACEGGNKGIHPTKDKKERAMREGERERE